MIFCDYVKAGGWIPGLIYIGVAVFCQTLRVYIDLWLSQWTDEDDVNFNQENRNVTILGYINFHGNTEKKVQK